MNRTLITAKVNLGKFFNFCEFKFLYLQNGIIWGLNKDMGAKSQANNGSLWLFTLFIHAQL